MPVGRVNERKPLGHSGQRRLHEVVGSMEILMGIPIGTGRWRRFDIWYPDQMRAAFSTRAGV